MNTSHDDLISRYLSEFNALPFSLFTGVGERWPDEAIQNIGKFLSPIDSLYYRDSMTRRHVKLYGPDLTLSQLMSRSNSHLRILIVEIDENTEDLETITELVEMTRPWRCLY